MLPLPQGTICFRTSPIHCVLFYACLLYSSLIVNLWTLVTLEIFLLQEAKEMPSFRALGEFLPSLHSTVFFHNITVRFQISIVNLSLFLPLYQSTICLKFLGRRDHILLIFKSLKPCTIGLKNIVTVFK